MLKLGFPAPATKLIHTELSKPGKMRIDESLKDVRRLFLDSAPVIYHIEENRRYRSLTAFVFEGIDQGLFTAVTSPYNFG